MKLRLRLTAEQAEAAILQGINPWIDDSYIDVRTLSENLEYWPASIDKEFFLPGDRVLVNSGGNIAGLRGNELLFCGRRHSLWQSPTIAGIFTAAGLIDRDESSYQDLITEAGKKANVLEYQSLRSDCSWWAVDLDHPEIVKIKKLAEQLSIILSGPEPGMMLAWDGFPVWTYAGDWENAVPFKWDGIAYRRAGASGINL